jgi:hypothetical protein
MVPHLCKLVGSPAGGFDTHLGTTAVIAAVQTCTQNKVNAWLLCVQDILTHKTKGLPRDLVLAAHIAHL